MTESIAALAVLFVLSAVTSFLATVLVKHVAERIGAVDHPDTERRVHVRATPRLGGLAIIFGFGFPLLLLAGNSHAAQLVSKNIAYLCAVLAAGSLIVGLGVYDDLIGANAPKKFAVQLAAAIVLVSFGFRFEIVSFGSHVINLGFVSGLVSVIWIIGVINAMNFIDGIDSLATVVAITIAVAFAIIGMLRYDVFSLVIMTALSGSLIGFYRWNRPPARIFMGDTGSLFIGLLLAAVSIAKVSKSPTALIIGGPVLGLALPVLDTLIVMKQRFTSTAGMERVTTMFNADTRHIHHILVMKYGSINKAIFAIWSVTLLFAVGAVLTAMDGLRAYGYGVAALGLVVLVFLRYAGMTGAREA
jgi:UDP-GlcNAc:undecaprenyl-phosphate GlcNAc-1-phosphate transferase